MKMVTVGQLKDMLEGLDDSTPVAAMVGGYYGGHSMPHKVWLVSTMEEKAVLVHISSTPIYQDEAAEGSQEEAVLEECAARYE
jgi:hypothetical protein